MPKGVLLKKIKLNTDLGLIVKAVDINRRIIITSHRPSNNPYQKFFDSLGTEKLAKVKLLRYDTYGVIGAIDNLKVFIPISETHIANNSFVGGYANNNEGNNSIIGGIVFCVWTCGKHDAYPTWRIRCTAVDCRGVG